MKIIPSFLALALLTGILFSCKKSKGPALPNVSNFSLADSGTFVPGGRATVTVNAPNLPDGNYTIYYFVHRSFQWVSHTPFQSALVLSNHTGTFQTEPLDTSNYVVVQADSIVNAGGGGATVNNIATFTDSTGMITAKMDGTDAFRTVNVIATHFGPYIELQAYLPKAASMAEYRFVDLFIDYNHGVLNTDNTSGYGGSYGGLANNAIYRSNIVHGEVAMTTLATLFSGSFSATFTDSSKMTGTFSCPAP